MKTIRKDDEKKMSKEYECFGYKDMMQLMNAIKAYDYDGWQLVSVGHNGKFYFAVVQRDKIEIEESEEKWNLMLNRKKLTQLL